MVEAVQEVSSLLDAGQPQGPGAGQGPGRLPGKAHSERLHPGGRKTPGDSAPGRGPEYRPGAAAAGRAFLFAPHFGRQGRPGRGTAGTGPGRGRGRRATDFRPGAPQPQLARRLGAGGARCQPVRLLADGALFPSPARTMAGLSNLRSGLRQTYPAKIDEACLYMLAGAGLSWVLADVLQPGLMETVRFINQAV